MDLIGLIKDFIQNPIFIISLIFWALAFIIIKIFGKKKENVTIFFPFLVLFRSKLFNRIFKKIAKRGKKIWKIWWSIGVVVSFIFMLFALYFFVSNLFQLIFDPKPENAIVPLIPGVTISLPMFTALILPLLVTVTIHEFSHAIAAEVDGVNIKSSGIFGGGLFIIIGFGAFVEIDEFQMYSSKCSTKTRLRIAAAGVWSNIILAGFVLLILNSYPNVMNVGYETKGFRITNVIATSEGGFNENNVEIGDIVYKINDTLVDLNNHAELTDFLVNNTDIQVTQGDELQFTCINPENGEFYIRNITLGFRSFVGFATEKLNNTAFNVTEVYSTLIGGNNVGNIPKGTIITKFNSTNVNYDNNQTFKQFLTQKRPNYKINLTSNKGKIYEINVNYFPMAPGAHVLHDIYIGLDIQKENSNSIIISYVFNNETEFGNNEENIPKNTIITAVNGQQIQIGNQTFKEFVEKSINPIRGESLIFTDQNGRNYTLNTSKIPIIPVFVGIQSEDYWISSNWIGKLFGGYFPNKFYTFLMYTWMISFSLALFNLLPTAIFDGGRMIKEVIDRAVGIDKFDKKATKKIRYEYDPDNHKQHLFTQGIKRVISVNKIETVTNKTDKTDVTDKINEADKINETKGTDKEKQKETIKNDHNLIPIEFKSFDTSTDGFIDTVELNEPYKLEKNDFIVVEVMYEKDLKGKLKKKIYRGLSWGIGLLLIASFLISMIKFENTFFWLE